MKQEKTNVMRLLDEKGIEYRHYSYDGEGLDGNAIAGILGQDPERVFKTLITVGRSGGHYVFMVPVCGELDLKKAAKAAGEKSLEMLPQKQLLPLTGYVHGGCSPMGLKKQFPVFLDESADYVAVFEDDPDWQNPVMNFVGEYQSGRAHALVE